LTKRAGKPARSTQLRADEGAVGAMEDAASWTPDELSEADRKAVEAAAASVRSSSRGFVDEDDFEDSRMSSVYRDDDFGFSRLTSKYGGLCGGFFFSGLPPWSLARSRSLYVHLKA